MPRLAPLDLNKLDPEQKKVADAIMSGPRGGLRGPFEPLATQPACSPTAPRSSANIAASAQLAAARTCCELAICLVGRHFKAQYEFYAHARLAKEAGLLRRRSSRRCRPARQSPPVHARRREDRLRLRHRVSRRPTACRRPTTSVPSTPSASRASSIWWACCGYYMLVSMTLNVFEMPLPPGEPDPAAVGRRWTRDPRFSSAAASVDRAVAGPRHLLCRRAHPGRRPRRRPGVEPGHGPGRAGAMSRPVPSACRR